MPYLEGNTVYFGVMKIIFEDDGFDEETNRSVRRKCCGELRKKYSVAAKHYEQEHGIVVSVIKDTESSIEKFFDQLSELVENIGTGRVSNEWHLIEPVDLLMEESS